MPKTAEKAVYGEDTRDSTGKPIENPVGDSPKEAPAEEPKSEAKVQPKVEKPAPAEEKPAEAPAPAEETPAEEPEKSDKPEIKKGLYAVADLAACVDNLTWIVESAEFEAQYEGDNSTVPAQLKAAVAQVGAALVAMATEEVAEAAGGDDVEVVELADRPADLEKMVAQKLDATKDDLLKSLTEAVAGKVGEQLKPLEDRLARLESQPAGNGPKAAYTVVDKADDAPAKDELAEKVADMEANPHKYTAFERSDLAAELFKRSSRARPIVTN